MGTVAVGGEEDVGGAAVAEAGRTAGAGVSRESQARLPWVEKTKRESPGIPQAAPYRAGSRWRGAEPKERVAMDTRRG